MTEYEHSYCIAVTYKCNWFCDYCSEDTHNKSCSREELEAKLNEIVPVSDVAVTGGEPGMLDEAGMDFVITELKKKNCYININTNGVFFKKHKKWCNEVDSFLYHCSENLDIEEELYIPDFIPLEKITFQLTITDDNVDKLEAYLDKYPDIKFLVFGADEVVFDTWTTKSLSKSNGIKTAMKFKDRLDPDSRINLIARCEEVNSIRKLESI